MSTPPASQSRRLTVLLLILLLLTGCGGPAKVTLQPTGAPAAATISQPPAPPQPTALPEATATPAPTPLPALHSPIVWYLRGSNPPDLQWVNDQFNRVLTARGFNAQVELSVIARGLFDKQMAQVQAAGQPWDLVSLPMEQYFTWARRGDLLPLVFASGARNLLAAQAPGIWTRLPEDAWKGLSRPSFFAAVPNLSKDVRSSGISIRADVVQALNLQAQLDEVKTWSDLTPILVKIQAADADKSLTTLGVAEASRVRSVIGQSDLLRPEAAGYDVLAMPFVTRYNDVNLQVVNWVSTPEFKTMATLMQDWRKAGFLPDEPLTLDEAAEGYRTGRYLVEVGHQVGPGSAVEQADRYGFEWIDVAIAPSFRSTSNLLASTTAINARIGQDEERVRRVLLLLDWLHTDPEIYNLLAYGIESQHWNWADQGMKQISLSPGSTYLPDFRDQLGDSRLAYVTDPRMGNLSSSAAPFSPALGFFFDSQPVAGEVLSIQGLLPELIDPLANGQVKNVDQSIARLNKALEDAGSKAIEAELARQLQEWKAAR